MTVCMYGTFAVVQVQRPSHIYIYRLYVCDASTFANTFMAFVIAYDL